MINSATLRAALKEIFGIADRYLVPMDSGWYVPTYDKDDKVGTWIGYRILSIKPNLRAGQQGNAYSKSVKCRFRLSFIGKQAESIALQTLVFDERQDVAEAFAKSQTQLNYTSRELLTYPIREGGLNDSLCWFVDIECQSFYDVEWRSKDWDIEPSPKPEPWFINVPTKESGRLESGTLTIKR